MEKAAGNRGKGRPKGSLNKTTKLLKDEILQAADKAHPDGRVGYLAWLANEHPPAFSSLLGKVLPTQIAGDPDGAPIRVQRIERVVVDPLHLGSDES